jgi:hypothetical protein
MITKMHIQNFKCFKDFEIELGPFNVLIGPNDSGKTAFLETIRLIGELGPTGSSLAEKLVIRIGPESVWRQESGNEVLICADAQGRAKRRRYSVKSSGGEKFTATEEAPPGTCFVGTVGADTDRAFDDCVGRVRYYHFDPGALRRPSLVRGSMNERGDGFPTYLDDMIRADRARFSDLESRFYERFPHYRGIVIDKTEIMHDLAPDSYGSQKVLKDAFVLKFETTHGETLPAEAVSDGVMLSLAFIALAHSKKHPRIMLVEQPEHGVHHAALKDIVATLHDLADNKGVQVVLTTHSPYLLDLVEPKEVRIFSKDEEGAVHAVKLSDYPEVEKLRKYFMTGEIWTEFNEAEIVKGAKGNTK